MNTVYQVDAEALMHESLAALLRHAGIEPEKVAEHERVAAEYRRAAEEWRNRPPFRVESLP